jgi:hypothetical protein
MRANKGGPTTIHVARAAGKTQRPSSKLSVLTMVRSNGAGRTSAATRAQSVASMPDNFIVGNFVADDFIADNFITGDDGWRGVIKVIFISPASADSANPDG